MPLSTMTTTTLGSTLLPTLIAFLLAPHKSLRNWIAVSALPAAEPVKDECTRRSIRRRKLAGAAVGMSILGFEVYALTCAKEGVLDKFIMIILALALQMSTTLFMADMFGAYKVAAYRQPAGTVIFRPVAETKSRFRIVAAFIIAGLFNALAIYCPHVAVTNFVVGCIIYRFVSGVSARTISIRGIMFVLLGWLALSFTLSGVVITYLVKSGVIDKMTAEMDAAIEAQADQDPVEAKLDEMTARIVRVFVSSFIAAAPGFLLAALYRFDYHQHQKRQAETGEFVQSVSVELVEAPKRCGMAGVTSGAIVPASVSRAFSRPLYTTGLFAWFISQVAVAGFMRTISLQDAEDVDLADVFNCLALALEIPMMVVAVLVRAAIGGQFKEMWTYREEWSKKAVAAVQHDTAEVEAGEDEKLPAYTDAAEDVEAVPAYAPLIDVKA